MKKTVFVSIAVLLVLCSCAVSNNTGEEQFFQLMGNEDCFVFTAKSNLTENFRVSLEVYEDSSVNGILELKGIPSFITDAKIRQTGSFERIKSRAFSYYESRENSLCVAVLDNGCILFSNNDIHNAYDRFVLNPKKRISDTDAFQMLCVPYAGLFTNQEGLKKVIVLSENLIDADFNIEAESIEKANTFVSLIKAKEIEKYRKAGIKPDYEKLSEQISVSGEDILLKDFSISESGFPVIDFLGQFDQYTWR